MMKQIIYVFAGGGAGSVLRYIIGLVTLRYTASLPLGTFIANVTACLIYAIAASVISSRGLSEPLRLALLTGLCGGLSTFSTFGYETFALLRNGMAGIAMLNILLTTGVCLLIFYIFSR